MDVSKEMVAWTEVITADANPVLLRSFSSFPEAYPYRILKAGPLWAIDGAQI